MTSVEELAGRLAAVEKTLAQLQEKINSKTDPGESWLKKITGTVPENDPVFAKILEYGREARYADRPADEIE